MQQKRNVLDELAAELKRIDGTVMDAAERMARDGDRTTLLSVFNRIIGPVEKSKLGLPGLAFLFRTSISTGKGSLRRPLLISDDHAVPLPSRLPPASTTHHPPGNRSITAAT